MARKPRTIANKVAAAFCAAFVASGALAFPARANGTAEPATIFGLWRTADEEAVIEFYPCGSALCGRFHALKDDPPGDPSRDDRNPDPDKRRRPLCGLTFIGGFHPVEGGGFSSGWIYSPRHGATFSAAIALTGPETLELSGYMFLPFLGETQTWRRAPADTPRCPNALPLPARSG